MTCERALDDPSLRFVRPVEGVLTSIEPPAIGATIYRHMLLGIALQRAAFWIGAGVLVSTLCALLRARTALTPRSGDSR